MAAKYLKRESYTSRCVFDAHYEKANSHEIVQTCCGPGRMRVFFSTKLWMAAAGQMKRADESVLEGRWVKDLATEGAIRVL